jgi:hypothetical protein
MYDNLIRITARMWAVGNSRAVKAHLLYIYNKKVQNCGRLCEAYMYLKKFIKD